MTDPTPCSRIDCNLPAVANPELRAWAISTPPAQRTDANCARYRIRLPVCQSHAATCNAADFMSDQGWADLEKFHAAQGIAAPDRASLTLAWVHLLPGDA